MGKENRRHDEQTNKLADKYDKIKAENKKKTEEKEKARIEKYEKPFQDKKSSHTLQMELHKLVFDVPEVNRDHNWKQKFNVVRELMQESGIWEGFVKKYQLNRRGLD